MTLLIDNKPPLQGEGATHVAVGDRDGKVILQFPRPVQWIALDQTTAAEIAESIMRASFAGRPVVKGSDNLRTLVAEKVRQRLLVRVTHIIRSLTEKGRAHAYIAKACVDAVLKEVV